MSHKIFRWFTSLFLGLTLSVAGFTPALAAAPGNDNFDFATAIGTLPFSDSLDITEATTELGEPGCFTSQTAWYSFTPTANAVVTVDTQGSDFSDTTLDVYQSIGSGIGNLNLLNCASFGGSYTFNAQVGTTYYLQAGKYFGGVGTVRVNVQEIPPPANDNFSNAISIGHLPYSTNFDTTAATFENGEPVPSCFVYPIPDPTIWFSYTPAQDETIMTSVNGSNLPL